MFYHTLFGCYYLHGRIVIYLFIFFDRLSLFVYNTHVYMSVYHFAYLYLYLVIPTYYRGFSYSVFYIDSCICVFYYYVVVYDFYACAYTLFIYVCHDTFFVLCVFNFCYNCKRSSVNIKQLNN